MGNCGSALNCTQCYSEFPEDGCLTAIEVDPDVAGLGVLTAFFSAAVLTCASILYGYLSDSLPESLLSETDKVVIRWFHKSFFATKLGPLLSRTWLFLKKIFYWCTFQRPLQYRDSIAREQQVEGVTRFLLGFSDQQLVTGNAILIAALANRCRLTLHELRIAYCLAWFSATTHIATLKVLREYFYTHGVVRNWRVLGIVSSLVFLCYFQVILLLAGDLGASDALDPAKPIQCIMSGRDKKETFEFVETLNGIWLLAFVLIPAYVQHTIDLFYDPKAAEFDASVTRTSHAISLAGGFRKLSRSTLKKKQQTELIQNVTIQESILVSARGSSLLKNRPRRFTRYRFSFLHYVPTILFALTYGITQTVVVMWVENPKITEDVRRMGFGQVVALALLAIPALAAAETYNEARETYVSSSITPASTTATNSHSGTTSTAPPSNTQPTDPSHQPNAPMHQPNDPSHQPTDLPRQPDTIPDTPVYDVERMIHLISDMIDEQSLTAGYKNDITMTPARRNFIAATLLRYTLSQKSAPSSPSTPVWLISTLHAVVQIFGAISFFLTSETALAGNLLLIIWGLLSLVDSVVDHRLRYELVKQQVEVLKMLGNTEMDALAPGGGSVRYSQDRARRSSSGDT